MRPTRVLVLIGTLVALAAASLPAQASADAARIDPELARELDAASDADVLGAFVHFSPSVRYADGAEAITGAGLTIGADLPAAHLAFAYGPAAAFDRLAGARGVTFLEHAGTEPLLMETATWATRARTLYEETGGLDLRVEDDSGNLLDGAGVGIAIVDSGVDASHPDLAWHEKTVRNFKVLCGSPNLADGGCAGNVVMEDREDSDTTSGHGTHVAGIAAGDGTLSDGDGNASTTGDRMFRGAAPGAKLYGFGAGEGLNILVPSAAAAFQWIIDNGANPCGPQGDPVACPPIRVVNNSWGSPGAFPPEAAISKLTNALVQQGITVVFAAGNSGGDGSTVNTTTYGNNPTPGVLSVANYFDNDTGSRNAELETSSSRGHRDRKETWPDVSAPGTLITSTCKPTTVACNLPFGVPSPAYPPRYAILAGTSMAAPHTAGVIALLYQADPTITPAAVEDVLEDTAHEFRFEGDAPYQDDPTNPDSQSSFDKGHGLVDARLSALEVSGLPADHGLEPEGAKAAPSISIDSPADGSRMKRLSRAAGTANTGGGSTITTVIATGDSGDYAAVDSLDLAEVRLTEDVIADTVRVDWQVRGTSAPTPGTTHAYWLFTSIDGVARRLGVSWNGTTATRFDAQTPTQCTPARSGTVISLTCPAASLGATQGAVLFDAFAATFRGPGLVFGGIAKGSGTEDVAPGGLGATSLTLPERGQEHVFVGQSIDPPLGQVLFSVDGGTPRQVASGTGAFAWGASVGPTQPGAHTLEAILRIDGVAAARDSVTVFKGHD